MGSSQKRVVLPKMPEVEKHQQERIADIIRREKESLQALGIV